MAYMLQLTAPFVAFIFYSSLKASVLITLVLLAQKTLGRFLSSSSHYLLWLPVVISLLTPFGFETALPQPSFIPQQLVLPMLNSPTATNLQLVTDRQASLPGLVGSSQSAQSPGWQPVDSASVRQTSQSKAIDWLSLLPLAWLTGTLLCLGIVLVRSFRFSTLVRRALPANSALQNLLAACCKETNCKAGVRLRVSPEIDAPLVAGCFTPTLLLPENVELRLSTIQLRHVFLHELMHIKRKDIASNWLLTLLQCLHWFNPLVWFALTQMRHDRELVCDAATVHHLGPQDGQAYGHTLLQLCQSQPRRYIATHGIGIASTQAQLRRRILLIVQASIPNRFQSVLAGLLLLVLGGLAFSKPVVEDAVEATASAKTAIPISSTAVAAAAVMPGAQGALALTNAVPESAQSTTAASPSVPATHAVKSKRATITSTTAALPAAYRSTATHPEQVVGQTAAPAVIAMADTNLQQTAAAAAETIAAKPQETWSGLAAMNELTRSINAAKSADLKFITEWNATASACIIAPGQHKRRIPCELVKVAKSSSKFSDLKSQCAGLSDKYNKLARDYSATPRTAFVNREAIAATMLGNYQNLTEFCSVATYNKEYPAFAKLFNAATANSRLAAARTAFETDLFSDASFTYPGTGSGANVVYTSTDTGTPATVAQTRFSPAPAVPMGGPTH